MALHTSLVVKKYRENKRRHLEFNRVLIMPCNWANLLGLWCLNLRYRFEMLLHSGIVGAHLLGDVDQRFVVVEPLTGVCHQLLRLGLSGGADLSQNLARVYDLRLEASHDLRPWLSKRQLSFSLFDMQPITAASLFIRAPDLISTDMDGDTVMLNIERGEYFGIGGVGTRAWELLEQPVSMWTIVQTICAEYDVDEATCLADMQAFFNELLKDRMIKPA